MARVLIYERVVDAVLTETRMSSMHDIQNGVKIKEEPDETTLNINTAENDMLISDSSNNNYNQSSENNVSCKNAENSNNKLDNHSTYSNDISKKINLKRKNTEVRKEQKDEVLLKPREKRRFSNNTFTDNRITSYGKVVDDLNKKEKEQSVIQYKNQVKESVGRSFTRCDICFVTFFNSRNRRTHQRYYAKINGHKCNICNEQYASCEELRTHILSYHKDNSGGHYTHICHFCGRGFKARNYMQSHLFHVHADKIRSVNITETQKPRFISINTSYENDVSKINEKESKHLSNPKLKNLSIVNNADKSSWDKDIIKTAQPLTENLLDNEISPSKKLRQPTLTEYLELCKKKRDIKFSPNKSNATRVSSATVVLRHDKRTDPQDKQIDRQENLGPDLLKETMHKAQTDALATKPNSLPEQMTPSTSSQSEKYEECFSKKPFVRLHADVEMMKSFLENLPVTAVKTEMIEDEAVDAVSYEAPYSLRSSKIGSFMETSVNTTKRKNKNMHKKPNTGNSIQTTKQNVTALDKLDSEFWRNVMTRFKCKNCIIPLTKCDEKLKNSHRVRETSIKTTFQNISLDQCNPTLFQRNNTNDNTVLKELEISVERLKTVPIDIPKHMLKKIEPDVKNEDNNCFLCKICKKNFSSKLDKRSHIKLSHVAYMSSICKARYTLKHKLIQHYLCEHVSKKNKCCVCNEILSDYTALKRHLIIHCIRYVQTENDKYPIDIEIKCNSSKKTYICLYCKKTFSLESSLTAHQSCCLIQEKELAENQEDSTKETSTLPKIILKVHRNKDIDRIIVAHDEKTQDDLHEISLNESVEKLNNIPISPVNEKEQDNENTENSSSNKIAIAKKSETGNEQGNITKLPTNDDPTSSNPYLEKQIVQSSNVELKNVYPCGICGKRFQNHKNLQQHIRTFSSSTDICPMCNTAFSSKRLLRTHIVAAHVPELSKNYDFHCMFCNQGFIKKHELRTHLLHLHVQQMFGTFAKVREENTDEWVSQVALCNICNLVFETNDRYVEHKMYYYKNHKFTCTLCQQDFQGMYMFHHHQKLTHYSEDRRKSYSYVCDICNEGFSLELHFHSHNMHVHASKENVTETIKESKEQEAQEQKDITKSNEYTCQICQLKCTNADDITKHEELYSNDGEFLCEICTRRCRTLDLLDQHKKLTHSCRDIYNGYACCVCGEVMETITSLTSHEKHFHPNTVVCSNDDFFKCKNCGQIFSSKNALEEHRCKSIDNIQQNTTKYRYNCLYCDMKFSSAEVIQTHIAQAHFNNLTKSFVKPNFPVDGNNTQRQAVQLIQADEASVHENLIESSELSDNTLNNIKKIQNKTIELSNQCATSLSTENGFNTSLNMTSVPTNKFNVSTPTDTITSNNGSEINSLISTCTGSLINLKTNESQRNDVINSIESSNMVKNSISSKTESSKSQITATHSSTKSVNELKIIPLVVITPPLWKKNGTTNTCSQLLNGHSSYVCPLCPLTYPTLTFFHAHLRYMHADAIRTDLTNPQSNQNTFVIECLLCPRTFFTDTRYKKHLQNSHTQYIRNIEIKSNSKTNLLTTQSKNAINETPEIITLDDDDNDNDNDNDNDDDDDDDTNNAEKSLVEHATTKQPMMADINVPNKENEKIGKLKVKSFAKMV